MKFFNPRLLVKMHGGKLPHWQQEHCPQFITFREHDSLPQALLSQWREEKQIWLKKHPEPHDETTRNAFHARFTQSIEDALDQGMGTCVMRDGKNRQKLEVALMLAQNDQVEQLSWVIMPNHVHILCIPRLPLPNLIKIWKGVSARKVGRGKLWQANYRDTLIRNETHFKRVVHYIRNNPSKLPTSQYTLWESDIVKKI